MIYALESNTMPTPGFAPLSAQERELLLQWLGEGAAKGNPPDGNYSTPYSYYADTRAIIEQKCVGCHRPGENAPFSLTEYDSVYAVRAAVAHQMNSNVMPPWPPTNHFLTLQDNRSLSDDDKAVLNSWLTGGAPAGNPADYVPARQDPTPIDYNLTVMPNEPFALHSVYLHQHVLGVSNSIELIRENGTEIMLVDIRDWDFDWQDEYTFEREIIVQPGDKFRLTCNWDNSAGRQQFVNGRQLEPRYVEFGEGTFDEMCVSYFYVTPVRQADRDKLQEIPPTVAFRQPEHMQVFNPGDYVPVELLVYAFSLQEPNSSHAAHGHTDETGAIHDHRTGHYHISLDTDADTDADSADHAVGWDSATFYRLPDNIEPGRHTLWVSLRDDMDQSIGIDSRATFVVEAIDESDQRPAVESLVDMTASFGRIFYNIRTNCSEAADEAN